ncbi:MAG: hypothetical protein WBO10_05335 [Pyrinomonadaceae bacterium]
MKSILVILLALLFSCCYSTEDIGNVRWGIGDDFDLPRMFESVCKDDPNKCGDTHIDYFDAHMSVSFTRFETNDQANQALLKEVQKATTVDRSGPVNNGLKERVGHKFLMTIDSTLTSGDSVRQYSLAWTRGSRLTQIWSESMAAVLEYEEDRGL